MVIPGAPFQCKPRGRKGKFVAKGTSVPSPVKLIFLKAVEVLEVAALVLILVWRKSLSDGIGKLVIGFIS